MLCAVGVAVVIAVVAAVVVPDVAAVAVVVGVDVAAAAVVVVAAGDMVIFTTVWCPCVSLPSPPSLSLPCALFHFHDALVGLPCPFYSFVRSVFVEHIKCPREKHAYCLYVFPDSFTPTVYSTMYSTLAGNIISLWSVI